MRDSSEYSVLYQDLDTPANFYAGGPRVLHLLLRVSALRELLWPDRSPELLAGPPTDELAVAIDPVSVHSRASAAGGGEKVNASSTPDWGLNVFALTLDADGRLLVKPHRFDRVIATAAQIGAAPNRTPGGSTEKRPTRHLTRALDANKFEHQVIEAAVTERVAPALSSEQTDGEVIKSMRSANASEPNGREQHFTRHALNKKAAKRQLLQQQHLQHNRSNSLMSSSAQSDTSISTANSKAIPANGGQSTSTALPTAAQTAAVRKLVASPMPSSSEIAPAKSRITFRGLLLLIFGFLLLAVVAGINAVVADVMFQVRLASANPFRQRIDFTRLHGLSVEKANESLEQAWPSASHALNASAHLPRMPFASASPLRQQIDLTGLHGIPVEQA